MQCKSKRDQRTAWTQRAYPHTNLWWSWGVAALAVIVIRKLINSNYGLGDESHPGGRDGSKGDGSRSVSAPYARLPDKRFFFRNRWWTAGTPDNDYFARLFLLSVLTFNLLIIIVVGGLGSTTGAVIGAVLFAWGGEALRIVERPMQIGSITIPGIPGMRMVIFSLTLMLVILFARKGIMGRRELSWGFLASKFAEIEEGSQHLHESFFQMRHVTKEFGGLTAVSDFSITLERGELTGLIGPNGAGKTTVFNMITGLLKPTQGDIIWNGEGHHPASRSPDYGKGHRAHFPEYKTFRRYERDWKT